MKAVIFAGGYGTRISEESHLRPKPMIDIGGRPILWHIMKLYAVHGIKDFVICAGYKAYIIKEYFLNYFAHNSDISVDLSNNDFQVHQSASEDWRVTIIDTGEKTMTAGRLKRVRQYVGEEDFCLTYGDGLASVNIRELIRFHQGHGKLATVTAVQPPGRFGQMTTIGNQVQSFIEKPTGDGGYINGGFFVLSPKVFDLIKGDTTIWEREPMEELARSGQMQAYHHDGFWLAMDTLRDKTQLEELWASGEAPWKTW